MYAVVSHNASRDRIVIFHRGTPSLETMQDAVGGYIERAESFDLPDPLLQADVFCNEEGLLMDLPYMYHTQYGAPVVGPLVIAGSDREGNTVRLNMSDIQDVLARMGII